MAKNKHVEIQETELKPTIIGEYNNKKKSILPLVLIFLILITVTYYLPAITEFIEANFSEETVKQPIINEDDTDENNSNNSVNDENDTVQKLEYQEGMSIEENDFKINNLIINNFELSFEMENKTDDDLDFAKYDYFLELYKDNMLVQRINFDEISVSDTIYEFEIFSEDINLIRLLEIKEEEYPSVTMIKNDSGDEILTCSGKNDELIYTFKEDILTTITETITIASDNLEYNSLFVTHNELSKTLNAYEGINSTFTGNEEEFNLLTIYNIEEVEDNNIPDLRINYFSNSKANVINFESESSGYICK